MRSIIEQAEIISGASFDLGIVKGREDAADFLLRWSGDLFMQGKDDMAIFLRKLVVELKADTKKVRQDYDDRQQPRQSKAYKVLEEIESELKEQGRSER